MVDENGEFRDRHMMKAFERILYFKEEIDVVNLSAGLDHVSNDLKECDEYGPDCRVCELADSVLEEGITIVAGAGNIPHTQNICCPSLEQNVISVGGATVECTASIDDSTMFGRPQDQKPPNALWVERQDGKGASGTYCSDRGCFPGASCSENQEITQWEGSPKTETGKPDLLSPLIYPMEDDVGPFLEAGTSYATPIVTATVSNVFRMLKDRNIEPRAREVRAALERSGRPIDELQTPLLDGIEFANELGRTYGLEFQVDEDQLFRKR